MADAYATDVHVAIPACDASPRMDRAGLWAGARSGNHHLAERPAAWRQLPGGISRWMAVPWQTDTASCRSGYLKSYDPNVPTFWPARVPNQVLTKQDYETVMDKELPLAERLAAFARRASWLQPLGDKSYTDQINNMITHFDRMGIVEQRDGPELSPFPAHMQVQELPASAAELMLKSASRDAEQLDLSGIERVPLPPWPDTLSLDAGDRRCCRGGWPWRGQLLR